MTLKSDALENYKKKLSKVNHVIWTQNIDVKTPAYTYFNSKVWVELIFSWFVLQFKFSQHS